MNLNSTRKIRVIVGAQWIEIIYLLLLASPCLLHRETAEGFETASMLDSSCSSPPEKNSSSQSDTAEYYKSSQSGLVNMSLEKTSNMLLLSHLWFVCLLCHQLVGWHLNNNNYSLLSNKGNFSIRNTVSSWSGAGEHHMEEKKMFFPLWSLFGLKQEPSPFKKEKL